MTQFQSSLARFGRKFWQVNLLTVILGIGLLLFAAPAMAHHAMDGRMPSNFFEGWLSGIAHPLIGPDHFAFIVAVGLLGASQLQGSLIPLAFVLAAMLGTGLHLMGVNVPGVELFVSGSILLFGILLAVQNNPKTRTTIALAGAAGIFHGYAYGESIFGAETTPLIAYLVGFTITQLIVAASAFWISKSFLQGPQQSSRLRAIGLVICGIGLAFLSSQIVTVLFSVS